MANKGNRGAALRITALTAALLGVYGVAGATADNLICKDGTCTPASADGASYSNTGTGTDAWVVKIENSSLTLKDVKVDAFGSKMRGIGVHSGSKVTLENATVTTDADSVVSDGWAGHGVQAWGAGSTVDINNSKITTGGASYSLGVHSQKDGVVTGTNNTILTTAAGSSGLEVDRNGRISLTKGTITTKGEGAAGVRALSGKGLGDTRGFITLDGTAVLTEGVGAIGLMAGDEDGAEGKRTAGDITFRNATVITEGASAIGARVESGSNLVVENAVLMAKKAEALTVTGSKSSAKLTNTTISSGVVGATVKTPAYVVSASDHADVTITGGAVDATGALFARGVIASSSSNVRLNSTSVSTVGSGSHAVHAYGPDKNSNPEDSRTPTITITGGSIKTQGAESSGVYAQNGGSIDLDGAAITTSGPAGFGAFGYNGGNITMIGGSINTSGVAFDHPDFEEDVGSYGVLSKNKSDIHLDGTVVTTTGELGEGLRAQSESEGNTSGSHITANNVVVRTSGAQAHGVAARGFGSSVTMTGGSITATGANSAGAFIRNRANLTLDNVKVVSAGPSLISSFRAAGSEQNINIGKDSDLTSNNGTLLLVKREAGAENGKVTLNLNEGSFASGNIVNHDGNGNRVDVDKTSQTIFNVRPGAHWAGIEVAAGDEVVDEGGTATYGDFTGNVVPGQNSTVTFTPGAQVTGSISSASGSTTTFTGDSTITGEVASQGGAMVFGGNTNIGSSVTASQGSTFTFGGTTQIGQPGSTGTAVAGQGTTFGFSRTAPTTIHGDVVLTQGSSVSGGSSGAPVQIVGNTAISDGARLGGNLVITGQLTGAGGVLSPGNSIGTVRVGSVASFPSTYAVEVNGAGASDLMIVDSGNVDLSASALTVGQENGTGGYVLNHDYTIIQMPGNTATTEFASAALDDSFANTLVKLDPVKYSQTDVKIALSPDAGKVADRRTGLSANQNATLDGVISVAGQNASADAALLSTDTGSALNQLSGEVHASTQSALLNSSSLLTNTIAKRMRSNVGAGMVAGAPVAQSSGSLPAGAMPSSAAYPLWAEVVGNWSTLDGDNNAAKVKSDTAGLFLGGDMGVGNGWRLGATLGFTDGKIKVNDRSSRSDVRSYTAAVYGGNSWATGKGNVNFLAGAGYTRHDIDSRRTVTIGGNQTLKADYKANTTHLFTELGYAMPVGNASVVEPYLGVAWISQRAKGFSESGGSAALSGQSQTDNVTTFTLGARGKTTVEAGRHEVRLSAGAGWRHASGDVDASRKMSFIQGNGATFQIAGAPIAKDAAVVDLGAEMTVGKNAAMGLAYSGQFGNGNTDSTGSLYLKYRFK